MSRSEDVFKQLEASWDTSEQAVADTTPATLYKPEDDNVQNASYEEFETPFKCTVLYNYTVNIVVKNSSSLSPQRMHEKSNVFFTHLYILNCTSKLILQGKSRINIFYTFKMK